MDCIKNVSHTDITKTTVRIYWSHTCLQCISWELGYKKITWSNGWGLFASYTNMSVVALSDFSGFERVVSGLNKNTKYKFRVKSIGGQACIATTIGTTTARTLN